MAKEITVRENQALRLKEHATGLIATLTDPEAAREFERGLTITKVIESAMPISVVKQAAGMKAVLQTLDISLTKLVASVNVSQNLNDGQIKIIVEDLIEKYPNESIEDFILVFKRARQGEFGTIYNLHSAVIFEWMAKYLDEKYDLVEKKIKRDQQAAWVEPTGDTGEGFKQATEYVKSLKEGFTKPVRPITEDEAKEEGQEKPQKQIYYRPNEHYVEKKEKHIRYLNTNYDGVTMDKLPGWMPEDQWNELND